MTIIIEPLGPSRILLHRGGTTQAALHLLIEGGTTLSAQHREVMLTPRLALWPQLAGRQHPSQALGIGHTGHTLLRVELGGSMGEIIADGHERIGTMTRDAVVGRTGDITQLRVERSHTLAQPLVEDLGRVALVATTVESQGGMATDARDEVAGVVHEHLIVGRVGAVPRIGEPEVLPDHQSVAVAGLEEGLRSRLSHPVAYHRHIHVAMVADSSVELARPIVEIGLREAPVASHHHDTLVVDEDLQGRIHILVGHLADARLVAHLVACGRESRIIEIRFTIAIGPPEAHRLTAELGEVVGTESHVAALLRGKPNGLLKADRSDPSAHRRCDGTGGIVGDTHDGRHRGQRIGRFEARRHIRVADMDIALQREPDVVPDTHLAARRGGDPVPADRGVESRVVESQDTSVDIGRFAIFHLYRPDMGVLVHAYLQGVVAPREIGGEVETSTAEGTLYAPHRLAIDEEVGFPIDAIQMEEHPLSLLQFRGQPEGGAIPKVAVEIALRDLPHRIAHRIVGYSPIVDKTRQDRARDRSGQPAVIAIASQLPSLGQRTALALLERDGRHTLGSRYRSRRGRPSPHLQFGEGIEP